MRRLLLSKPSLLTLLPGKRHRLLLVVLLCLGACLHVPNTLCAQSAPAPIGSWREHLPYGSTIDVTASERRVYAATPYALFSVDLQTNEVERISKVAGLSEVGISTIVYDPASQKLIIAYTNSNIDIIDARRINNVPGLKRKNITGDKTIYHLYPDGELCYASTGLGIIVLNTARYEIKDAWHIAAGGGYVKTWMVTKDATHFYAATEEGLKRTPLANPNPADFGTWENVSGTGGLPAGPATAVVNLAGTVIARQGDSLYAQEGAAWRLFFRGEWPILSVNESEGQLLVCQRTSGDRAQVVALNGDGTVRTTLQQPGIIIFPRKAIARGGDYWVADQWQALTHWSGGAFEQYRLNSPEDIATGELRTHNGTFYAAAGSINDAWNYLYNRSGVYQFRDGQWTNFNQFHYPGLDTLMDFITVAVDPRDASLWAGSYGGGLLHIKDGAFTIYKQNSPLQQMTGDPGSYRVSGLAFDFDHNLWVANYGAPQQLHVLKGDGSWVSFTVPFTLAANEVGSILIDDANQVWIVSPKGNGLMVLNWGTSLEDTNDDRWQIFRAGTGAGNLPSSSVHSVAKDKSGFLWVGTSDGLAVIYCATEVFSAPCEAVLPVATQGGFANYLFKGEEVRAIAVDGADRKWVATRNGVWLISPEGDRVIERFTETNSPLLSNDVRSIAIAPESGEVFFATARGLISFRGAATEPKETSKDLLVFPNPVPPGYTGTIAIRGLAPDSYVKITELNGRLVHQTRALGGQAVWNGTDHTGKRIATGVYLILVTDDQKREQAAGKIVFIH